MAPVGDGEVPEGRVGGGGEAVQAAVHGGAVVVEGEGVEGSEEGEECGERREVLGSSAACDELEVPDVGQCWGDDGAKSVGHGDAEVVD